MKPRSARLAAQAAPKGHEDEWLHTPEFASLGSRTAYSGYFGDRRLKGHPDQALWSAAFEILKNLRHRVRKVGLQPKSVSEVPFGSAHSLLIETYRLVVWNLDHALAATNDAERVRRFCGAVRCFARLPTIDSRILSERNTAKARKPRPPNARAAEMTPDALSAYAKEIGFTGKNMKVFYDKAGRHFSAPDGRVRKTWAAVRAGNLWP